MTTDEVRRRVEAIAQAAGDNEVAHSLEDDLHQDVLEIIASGSGAMAALAKEALRTREIHFTRWYA